MPAPTVTFQAPIEKLRRLAELQAQVAQAEQDQLAVYVTDPDGFVTGQLGEHLWSKQQEIAESVVHHRRTAVQSCHAVGKSYVASRLVAWWLATHEPGTAFVVSTAPTFQQVRGVLWREIGRAHRKGNLPGRVNQTEWWIGEEIVAFGRKPADTDPTAFQGIHAEYVLVVLDEACGIPRDLWTAALSLAANDKSRILAIGNPDDPGSHFAEVCKPGSGWHQVQIGYSDTPNFTDEPIPEKLRPLLIGPVYVEEMRHDVGETSAPWISKVLGEFPDDADDGVVRVSAVRHCQLEQEHEPSDLKPVELGWDVGAGGDKSVVWLRHGCKAVQSFYPPGGADPMVQVGHVVQFINDTGAEAIKVDVIGIGWGVAGRLEELAREGKHGARVVKVNVGAASTRPNRFPKLRDQIWWEVGRMLSEDGGWDLSACDEQVVAQLTAPKYTLDSSGRIKVEPKTDTRSRIGRSPDDADALLLAFFTGAGQGSAFIAVWTSEIDARDPNPAPAPLPGLPEPAGGQPPLKRGCKHRWATRGTTTYCVMCGGHRLAENPDPNTPPATHPERSRP